MLVIKGHKILLQPNNKQQARFIQWCGAHRFVYNWGLERWKEAYEKTQKSPSTYGLMQEIVRLKGGDEYGWLGTVSKSVPRVALVHLEVAFQAFFRRCKNNTAKKGYPKWKNRKRSKMVFHLEPDQVRLDKNRVCLPKIGWVRMTRPLRWDGKLVGTVAVSKYAGRWYISFNCEVEVTPVEKQGRVVGIDLGVRSLAVLSEGTKYEAPRSLRYHERVLARAQRQLQRRQKGSRRWQRAKLRVQHIHKRIRDIRVNAVHQATSKIVSEYDLVALEDLNVSGMMQNHRLAKSVADAAMREFRRQIEYKQNWRGGEVAFVDRFFPSSKICSACGCINGNLMLGDREWTCFDCGVCHDRDKNAAKNILAKGLQMAEGCRLLRVEG